MRKLALSMILIVGSAGLVGCSHPQSNEIQAKPLDSALSGRLYATAGPTESQSDLYQLQFPPDHLALYQLTTTGRTFGVDGCPSALIVDVAGKDVDFQDALRRFDAGSVSPIDGLSDDRGALMSVAPDCRILYLRLDRSTNPPTGHLMAFDPAAKQVRELHAAGSTQIALGIADWGTSGRAAVFEGTAATEGHPTVATGIVIISADGSKRTIPSPVPEFGTLQWGASKWMALSDEKNRRTIFLDPDTSARSELDGWFPLGWSPDGLRLLVTDAATRKMLGLVDAADLSKVRSVGQTKNAAFVDLVWLPENAVAGGPLITNRRPDDGD